MIPDRFNPKARTTTRAKRRIVAARGRAFTLIEMLLAIAIFAIVLSAIHMVFYGAMNLQSRTSQAVERGLPLQQTVTILKRDLANIVLPGGTFFGELQTSQSTSASTNVLNTLSPVNDTVVGQSGPAFFTASAVIEESAPWSEIQRVSYSLAPSTNNTPGKDLVRSVTRNLLPVIQEQAENQRLMGGLQSIAFSYYDGLQWRDYWDSTVETNKLPRGIKVELQLVADENSRGRRDPIEFVVPVVLQPGTNQTSQASSQAAL